MLQVCSQQQPIPTTSPQPPTTMTGSTPSPVSLTPSPVSLTPNELKMLRSTAKPSNSTSSSSASPPSAEKTEAGYDSGFGSPHPPASGGPPPATLSIKPKRGRRKRGSSTAHYRFDDVFERTGRVLGSGAFSRVEVARNHKTGQEYAVKIIDKKNRYTRTRVLQELEILYRSKGHPNIIQLEQYFEGDEHFYLVFEMMRGGALINHIEKHKRFTEREAAVVVERVASALKHLHGQGIAHRDLKFENILCGDNFTDVKICDFDLGGQKLDIPQLSTPLMDSPVGSAEFMAPEVVSLFEGEDAFYDKSCDMWSLGVLVYIMVYGKPPFTGHCGLNCGWDSGEECARCQASLFRNITSGVVRFDENMNVSESVKHLMFNLLQKDAAKRLTASEVVEHEWVINVGNDNLLFTSENLRRNKSSALNLHSFSSQINEHVRRINSSQNLLEHQVSLSDHPSHQYRDEEEEDDPLTRHFDSIDIGGGDIMECWYDDGLDDIIYNSDEDPFTHTNSSPPDSPGLTTISLPLPTTPTELSDNTPVQSTFVFPPSLATPRATNDDLSRAQFYISSDDEEE